MTTGTLPPRLAARDRAVILLSLAGITGLAWLYLAALAARMEGSMTGQMMLAPQMQAWSWLHFLLTAVMWAVMMVGMMIPSATPMILLYARVVSGSRGSPRDYGALALFVGGYLLLWTGFSVVAALLQVGLEQLALLDSSMRAASPILGGLLLVCAGAYQFTPLKESCLEHCRSPIDFVMRRWRRGRLGALRMGVEHGLFCVGCCWVLMLLLFATGVMNLTWVALIAGFVLLEKLVPARAFPGRIVGVALAAAGLAVIAADRSS